MLMSGRSRVKREPGGLRSGPGSSPRRAVAASRGPFRRDGPRGEARRKGAGGTGPRGLALTLSPTRAYIPRSHVWKIGPVAQLGERCVRNAEVRGSTPLRSTSLRELRPLGSASAPPIPTLSPPVRELAMDVDRWKPACGPDRERGSPGDDAGRAHRGPRDCGAHIHRAGQPRPRRRLCLADIAWRRPRWRRRSWGGAQQSRARCFAWRP